MKIAVASTNGTEVNEHFGRAEVFHIYDLGPGGAVKSGVVKVTRLSVDDKNHPFEPEKLQAIAEALRGCARVYVAKIGERPAGELRKAGIEPKVYTGAIKDIRK